MRRRASALVIQDKRILLVRDERASQWDTPGGSSDPGETLEETLRREIMEEVGVGVKSFEPYLTYVAQNLVLNVPQEEYRFLATINGKPKPCGEVVELDWFSKADIESKRVDVYEDFYEHTIRQLYQDDLL